MKLLKGTIKEILSYGITSGSGDGLGYGYGSGDGYGYGSGYGYGYGSGIAPENCGGLIKGEEKT